MTAYIMFLRCVSYLIFVGVLMFIAGRFLPKSLFHHHRFPFRVFASEKRGTIYVHLGVRKWLATRCACANRIGMSTACSKASRPLSISTCSVRAATKHSACWPSATICAAMPLTANATPQKSAGSPRRNGRTFRITPTPRQPSCRRSWRTFPLCHQLPYNKSQTLANHSPAFSSARKATLCRRSCRCYFTLLAIRTGFSYTEHSSEAQIFARS